MKRPAPRPARAGTHRARLLCLALAVPHVVPALLPAVAHAAPVESKAKASFTAPASERRISSGIDKDDLSRIDESAQRAAGQPSSELEARHYFRERPDALFSFAKQREQKLLDELLKDRSSAGDRAPQGGDCRCSRRSCAASPRRRPRWPTRCLRLSELTWELARIDYLKAFEAWQNVPEKNRSADPPMPEYDAHGGAVRPPARQARRVRAARSGAVHEGVHAGGARRGRRGHSRCSGASSRDYPDSRFRPDAHMAMAEHIFNTDYDFKRALVEYDKVLAYQESELYDLALFKSAWCLWQLGKKSEAAVRFRKVLDSTASARRAADASAQGAAERSARVPDPGVHRGRAQPRRRRAPLSAGDRRRAPRGARADPAERHLLRPGALRSGHRGLRAAAADRSVRHARRPQYQLAIARGYMALDKFPKALGAYKALADGLQPRAPPGPRSRAIPRRSARRDAMIEQALREQALVAARAGAARRPQGALRARRGDVPLYLEHFDDSKESYRLTFYLGEMLFHRLGRNARGGRRLPEGGAQEPEGRVHQGRAVQRDRRLRARAREGGRPLRGRREDALRRDRERQEVLRRPSSCTPRTTPNDPDLPEILFRQGKLYYDRRIYDPAVRMFGQLLERYPRSPYAADAGELVLDSFNRAADYENIELLGAQAQGCTCIQERRVAEAAGRADPGRRVQHRRAAGQEGGARGGGRRPTCALPASSRTIRARPRPTSTRASSYSAPASWPRPTRPTPSWSTSTRAAARARWAPGTARRCTSRSRSSATPRASTRPTPSAFRRARRPAMPATTPCCCGSRRATTGSRYRTASAT